MSRLVGVAAAVACLAGTLARPASAEWRRIDTPNFIVIGDVGARDLREVAVEFEGFRETLGRVLSAQATTTPIPTVVVVFPNDRAFTPFKPLYDGKPVDVAGVFYPGRDVNYITLVHDGRPGRLRIVFHEYAHLVISNVSGDLPAWLSEGLAEYYSTYQYRRGGREAMIGRPIESHLRLLAERQPMPLAELIAVGHDSPLYNERERRSIFYAQSWALAHMLLLGEPSRVAELGAYVGQVQRGASHADAWKDAFGEDDLDRALSRYLRQRTFRVHAFRFPDGLAALDVQATPMPPADVSGFLAGLRIQQQRLDEAEALLAGAAGHDPAHLRLARAQLEIARARYVEAAASLRDLGEVSDWFLAYSAAVALATVQERARHDVGDLREDARARFRAVQRDRELPNVLARLALLDVTGAPSPSPETVTRIERARALAPGREDYTLIHARVLAELGEFERARVVLGPLMAPGMPAPMRDTARSWMSTLVAMERARQAAAGAPPPWSATEPAPAPLPAATPDSAALSGDALQGGDRFLLLRQLRPGEQRIRGTLTAIECPAGGTVAFTLATAEGPRTFAAPTLAVVDFITYRSDTPGGVTCGAPAAGLPVYLTWRDGAVVAIEFLPDR